jgi:hypothetical protein
VLVVVSGCSNDDSPRLTPVHGKVFYRGQALGSGTIVFAADPTRGTKGPLAQAEIQSDGSYTLKTGEQLGAVAGWHRVSVVAVDVSFQQGSYAVPRPLVPLRYGDPERSGLLCEVKVGQDNGINFNLE